jgi:RNA polymerase sigma-70 factor (ECF subfamily)
MLAGDQQAFSEFFDAYFPRLFRFALRRLGDADAAEEIAQATLVLAVRKVGTWRGEAALFTWLCTLCRRELSAYYERKGRAPALTPLDDDPAVRTELDAIAAETDDPERIFERTRLAERVRLTLDVLPPRYADALEWKYIQGLAVAEIATRLQSTPKAVESLLARARQAFREGFMVRS